MPIPSKRKSTRVVKPGQLRLSKLIPEGYVVLRHNQVITDDVFKHRKATHRIHLITHTNIFAWLSAAKCGNVGKRVNQVNNWKEWIFIRPREVRKPMV